MYTVSAKNVPQRIDLTEGVKWPEFSHGDIRFRRKQTHRSVGRFPFPIIEKHQLEAHKTSYANNSGVGGGGVKPSAASQVNRSATSVTILAGEASQVQHI